MGFFIHFQRTELHQQITILQHSNDLSITCELTILLKSNIN